jgi:PqqD family protein of HPr-rel-A system
VIEQRRWRPASDLVWTHFDDSDDWVVFHPQSGDVCLVTSSAHTLWTLISNERACTLPDLVASLATALGRAPDDDLRVATSETLAFMDRAGLVRPISP